jgi:hypothetical protein
VANNSGDVGVGTVEKDPKAVAVEESVGQRGMKKTAQKVLNPVKKRFRKWATRWFRLWKSGGEILEQRSLLD